MDRITPDEAQMKRQLESRLAQYGITHLAIQNVRSEGIDRIVADLNDTRNDQAVQILIDRATGHFIDVEIEPNPPE